VSSIATVTGCPAGTSSAVTSFATARPTSSGFQRAREKNWCARSCGQDRARPRPAQHPAHRPPPRLREEPQASPQNVRNHGTVNNGASQASRPVSEQGTGSVASGSIGGDRFIGGFISTADAPFLALPALGVCADGSSGTRFGC